MKEAGRRILEDLRNYGLGLLLAAAYVLGANFLGVSSCPMALLTGLPCPGCGMTRAALLFLQGHWKAAWQMHPFFYIVFVLAVLAFIQRYLMGRKILAARQEVIAVAVLAMVFYAYRMATVFPDRPPMTYEARNGIRTLLKCLLNNHNFSMIGVSV